MKGTQPDAPRERQLHLPRQGKILIVGGRSTNFPPDMRENPRLIFWGSTESHLHSRKKIPTGVKAVITTRFLKHKLRFRLESLLPPDVVMIPGVFGTGELRRLFGHKSFPTGEPAQEAGVKLRRRRRARRASLGAYQPPQDSLSVDVKRKKEREESSRELRSFEELRRHFRSS